MPPSRASPLPQGWCRLWEIRQNLTLPRGPAMAQMISPSTGNSAINSTQRIFIPVSALLLNTLMMAQMSRTKMIKATRLLNVEPMVTLLKSDLPSQDRRSSRGLRFIDSVWLSDVDRHFQGFQGWRGGDADFCAQFQHAWHVIAIDQHHLQLVIEQLAEVHQRIATVFL